MGLAIKDKLDAIKSTYDDKLAALTEVLHCVIVCFWPTCTAIVDK